MIDERVRTGAAADASRFGIERDARPVVLSVAFPYATVGARAVGGAEVICSQMEAAVGSMGFRSLVVAHSASEPNGALYGTEVPAETITEDVRALAEERQQRNIELALAEWPVALVHMHGLDFWRYRVPAEIPVLVTLHLPPSWYPEAIWALPPNYHLVCVSETQWRACPAEHRDRVAVVENGVEIPPADRLRSDGRYALMLARICPEKNLHTGLDAARLAEMPAMLGGEVFPYPTHEQYFREEIEPRLTAESRAHERRTGAEETSPTARFLGRVSRDEKLRVLSRAACLLLPSLAPETSSLVAMEAMAAGVPVIAMKVGALPEIVEDGRTGFLITPGEQATERMAEAIRRVPELDRATCRAVAEQRFPLRQMLDGYGVLYRRFALTEPKRLGTASTDEAPAACEVESCQTADVARVEVIRDDAALYALAPEWARVWEEDPRATPFQHPAWLLSWWKQFGPDGAIHTLALREAETGRLAGLAPTYVYQDRETGQRKLLLLGAGTSDYLGGVWSPCFPGAPRRALECATQAGQSWEVAAFQQLRRGGPLQLATEQAGLAAGQAEPTSVIDLGAGLPAKIRANVGRYRRRAELEGALSFRVAASVEEALSGFELLVRFHGQRWEGRGEAGVLEDLRVRAHHRDAIPRLFEGGLLRMFQLSLRGEPIGVLYAFADPVGRVQRRLYLYLIGFGQRWGALSPGTLLLHEVWKYGREHGFSAMDLLRGGESYKALWGAHTEPTFALEVSCATEAEGSCSNEVAGAERTDVVRRS